MTGEALGGAIGGRPPRAVGRPVAEAKLELSPRKTPGLTALRPDLVSRGGRRARARVGRRPDLGSWREVAEGRRRASVYRYGPLRIHVCGRLSSDLEKISKCWAGARARVARRPSVAERRRGRRRKALVEPVEMSRVPRPCDRRLPFGRRGRT